MGCGASSAASVAVRPESFSEVDNVHSSPYVCSCDASGPDLSVLGRICKQVSEAKDVPADLPKKNPVSSPASTKESLGDVASPASTPPSSADTDGAEHDGAAMPLPPGTAAGGSPAPNPLVTTWNEPEAERYGVSARGPTDSCSWLLRCARACGLRERFLFERCSRIELIAAHACLVVIANVNVHLTLHRAMYA
jgi:hypothetical protein